MSKHWNPEEDLAQIHEQGGKMQWPAGATAGLAIVAVACVSAALLLYKLAAPRDVFTP